MLFYRQFGSGDSFIILHGFLGISDNWINFAKIFSHKLHYKVIIPDLRNHGRSFHHPEHTYLSMLEDLIKLFKTLSIQNTHILGHSMGGKLAMLLSLMYPDVIRSLIVVDISPIKYENTFFSDLLEKILQINLAQFDSRNKIKNYLVNEFKNEIFTNVILKNTKLAKKNVYKWKANIKALYENIGNILDFPQISNSYSGKVLWIKGQYSPFILPTHENIMNKLFPNYQLCIIEKAGHFVHVDNEQAFSDCIIKFMMNQNF